MITGVFTSSAHASRCDTLCGVLKQVGHKIGHSPAARLPGSCRRHNNMPALPCPRAMGQFWATVGHPGVMREFCWKLWNCTESGHSIPFGAPTGTPQPIYLQALKLGLRLKAKLELVKFLARNGKQRSTVRIEVSKQTCAVAIFDCVSPRPPGHACQMAVRSHI